GRHGHRSWTLPHPRSDRQERAHRRLPAAVRLAAAHPTRQSRRNALTNRRDLMKLVALGGGAVYVSGPAGCAAMAGGEHARGDHHDFYFVQLSDSHWG